MARLTTSIGDHMTKATSIDPAASNADRYASIVAQDIRALEQGADALIARAGAMLLNLAEGRSAAGLDAAIGQDALVHVGSAVAAAISTRGQIVEAHSKFGKAARKRGLNFALLGPLEGKGEEKPDTTRPTGRLAEAI